MTRPVPVETTRRTATGADGLLLLDKPAGVTSHDVVQIARRAYGERSIGHLGTLDPFATGLLVLLLGRCTRLASFVPNEPKEYRAVIRFGTETDSDDSTGTVTVERALPGEDAIASGIRQLTGSISQLPPAYSAKQVDGQRAYAAARRGEPLALEAVGVTVHGWTVERVARTELVARIICSSGTYIRALARDLGRLAGSAAHLHQLRRLRSGDFRVEDAATVEQLASDTPPPVRALRVVAGD